jgi:NAD-dependent deacetylase
MVEEFDVEEVEGLFPMEGPFLIILGAGASKDSGLKTYRGKDDGSLYQHVSSPEELLHCGKLYDRDDRQRMLDFLQPLALDIERCEGIGPTYETLREYAEGGCVITQNVDGLAKTAFEGVAYSIIEAHGNLSDPFACFDCGAPHSPCFDADVLCPCGGFLVPGILLFGQDLPEYKVREFNTYIKRNHPKTVLVVGTSMMFPYLRHIISTAKHYGARVIHVNPDEDYSHNVRKGEEWVKTLDNL